ncbi:DUF4129 domain-containing protein [Cellulosimicrobium composti]|uniref:DUF4129 domain-containing protein n=1 Tax=Cellulosimicrobium composti TaxID=2672572 RepID=A0ABX0BFF0_9MICO|nr:DUF4129 domain-containing protein [Cellulosimicrobium composti]NDO90856.1 DUF4129 domain-containing protein [Cellulosimicrobium composti]TWG87721.1 uncharacterized protein DUF4129 [Cellulosimicrobium cellulans J34]SME97056.1 protein of unknown function [Cellulosimicrobium cellulans J1]
MTPWSLAADVPVQPGADEARRWLVEELAKPEYRTDPSLLQRFLDWLADLFDGATGIDLGGPATAALVVAGVALVAGIAYWVAGPVRLSRRAKASAVVLDDDTRPASDLRAAADDAAARGDWATAALERFRAVVRSLEERAVIDPRPGRTAWEAAQTAGERVPEVADGLERGAHLFDDVAYGKAVVGPEADAFLRALDERTLAARPALRPEVASAAAPGGDGA